jgi:hypothetical protein
MGRKKLDYTGINWAYQNEHYTVQGFAPIELVQDKYVPTKYLVKHEECGAVFPIFATTIKDLSKPRCPTCNTVIKGNVYNYLTVTGNFQMREIGNIKLKSMVYWECLCKCGNITWVADHNLKNGNVKSCGCWKIEATHKSKFKDLTGMVFGRLIPFTYTITEAKNTYWTCLCSPEFGGCGKIAIVLCSNLIKGNTTSCGCYNIECIRQRCSGKLSHFWKGGIAELTLSIRAMAEYLHWRQLVLERDGYIDQFSGKTRALEAHHIVPFSNLLETYKIKTLEEARNCKPLWDINNGITLAKEFHSNNSKNSKSFHRQYGTVGCTEDNFYEWFAGRPYTKGQIRKEAV